MKKFGWFGNLVGELFVSSMYCGGLWFIGWMFSSQVPPWGYYLAIICGMLAWSRPSYNRIHDFFD